jgi:hypothetical protein
MIITISKYQVRKKNKKAKQTKKSTNTSISNGELLQDEVSSNTSIETFNSSVDTSSNTSITSDEKLQDEVK